jgi:hypothetical protein
VLRVETHSYVPHRTKEFKEEQCELLATSSRDVAMQLSYMKQKKFSYPIPEERVLAVYTYIT